jgi:hypothetical protein
MTLVDANVILDVLTADKSWADWSSGQLVRASQSAPLLINEICYAELAVRAESQSRLDAALNELSIAFERTPRRRFSWPQRHFFDTARPEVRAWPFCRTFSSVLTRKHHNIRF